MDKSRDSKSSSEKKSSNRVAFDIFGIKFEGPANISPVFVVIVLLGIAIWHWPEISKRLGDDQNKKIIKNTSESIEPYSPKETSLSSSSQNTGSSGKKNASLELKQDQKNDEQNIAFIRSQKYENRSSEASLFDPPPRLLIPSEAVKIIVHFKEADCVMLNGKEIRYLNYNGNHIGYSFTDNVWFRFQIGSEKRPPFRAMVFSSDETLYGVKEYALTLCR